MLLPDGQTYANSVARKLRAGADRLDRLGPAGSDWRRGRAGGRPPVDPRSDRQASGSPASGGRRLQWGLVERAGSGRPSVKHSGCGARPDARAKEVAGSDRSMGEPGLRAGPHGATWLILPVVICLSQRLSHACLSMNCFILRNCEWLIKSVIVYLMVPYYSDNRSNSRANTCGNPDFWKGRIY